jgi:hypothetical protein
MMHLTQQAAGHTCACIKHAPPLPPVPCPCRWLYSCEGLPQEFQAWIARELPGGSGGRPVAFLDHAWGAISPQVWRSGINSLLNVPE